ESDQKDWCHASMLSRRRRESSDAELSEDGTGECLKSRDLTFEPSTGEKNARHGLRIHAVITSPGRHVVFEHVRCKATQRRLVRVTGTFGEADDHVRRDILKS